MNYDIILTDSSGRILAQGDAISAAQACGRFDVVVLCAEEFQPQSDVLFQNCLPYEHPRIIYAPNDDSILTESQFQIALKAANNVALEYMNGSKILVTCLQGRNRSGLVNALSLHILYGIGGKKAADIIRLRRKGAKALTNVNFNLFLNKIKPKQDSWNMRV